MATGKRIRKVPKKLDHNGHVDESRSSKNKFNTVLAIDNSTIQFLQLHVYNFRTMLTSDLNLKLHDDAS